MDSYEIYRQWCLDHNRTPPTREWWDSACAKPRKVGGLAYISFEPDFDLETEQREGWTYQ